MQTLCQPTEATIPDAGAEDAALAHEVLVLRARLEALRKERDEWLARADWLRGRLIDAVALRCAAAGRRRIALYGAGRHTAAFVRQPWSWRGLTVVAILDDRPAVASMSGVPVVRPSELAEPVDAVVVSSDAFEGAIAAAAEATFLPRGIPVYRLYGEAPSHPTAAEAAARLADVPGLAPGDAAWLAQNMSERHDATVPVLPPARTELHLRRYELAARYARGRHVLDAACGTGYGAMALIDWGGALSVTGLDVDAAAVAYARRRFGEGRPARFMVADATRTGLDDGSVGLVASFETIEHVPDAEALVAEFARVLGPGGRLVLSTPNDRGLTDHHVHSFTRESLEDLLAPHFESLEWWGQRAGDEPRGDGPPGMFRLTEDAPHAEHLIVVGVKRAAAPGGGRAGRPRAGRARVERRPAVIRRPSGEPGIGFVVFASAKSGTTWVQRLLSSHPSVHCAESRPFGEYFNPRNLSGPHLPVETFVKFLSAYYHAPVEGPGADFFWREVLFNVVDAIAHTGRAASGKPVYGEKVTPYAGTGAAVVRRLAEYNPALRFVHLVRDGRDVVVSASAQRSNNKTRFGTPAERERGEADLRDRRVPDEDFEEFSALWADSVAAGLLAADRFERTLDLRYERLIEDPIGQTERLLRFIGAPADPEAVESCVSAASFERLSGGRRRGEEDRASFFRKGQAGDWANWLTPEQAAAFELRHGALLDRLGYPRAGGSR